MVLTISNEEFVHMKTAALDGDKQEALRLIKEFVKRLEQQQRQGLKSHLDWQLRAGPTASNVNEGYDSFAGRQSNAWRFGVVNCSLQICKKTGWALMNLKKVNVELSESEVQELLAIDMDDDPARALAFIKEHLAKQVKKCLQPHWVPVFEASYGPSQKDRFARWSMDFRDSGFTP
jgi:hypothetical protein